MSATSSDQSSCLYFTGTFGVAVERFSSRRRETFDGFLANFGSLIVGRQHEPPVKTSPSSWMSGNGETRSLTAALRVRNWVTTGRKRPNSQQCPLYTQHRS